MPGTPSSHIVEKFSALQLSTTGLTSEEREEYEERIRAEREAAQLKLQEAEVGGYIHRVLLSNWMPCRSC